MNKHTALSGCASDPSAGSCETTNPWISGPYPSTRSSEGRNPNRRTATTASPARNPS
jgi:hypothetical protein